MPIEVPQPKHAIIVGWVDEPVVMLTEGVQRSQSVVVGDFVVDIK